MSSSLQAILIVDDSEDLLELMTMMINRFADCKALTAKSLGELQSLGLQFLTCRSAILDINLGPGEPSGIDAYYWLRRHGFAAPIYFLTGHAANHPLVIRAYNLNDAAVLQKPLSIDSLLEVIRGQHGTS